MSFGASSMLAQASPSSTALASVLAAATDAPRMEITRIVVANVTGSAESFQLCHDYDAEAGAVFDATNALWWDVDVPANESFVWEADSPGMGLPLGKVGALGFSPSTGSSLTITIYGASAVAQERSTIQPRRG